MRGCVRTGQGRIERQIKGRTEQKWRAQERAGQERLSIDTTEEKRTELPLTGQSMNNKTQ